MIPFCIEFAFPSDDSRNNNIGTDYDYCLKENLHTKIINFIIDFMNEFCSEDYGHNIQILSYDDFCDKFWQINGCYINGWNNIFRIYYFENKWIEWNLQKYEEEIFTNYTNKYINKKN
jgi:hypothetical protein